MVYLLIYGINPLTIERKRITWLDASEKIHWFGELFSCQSAFICPKSQKSEGAKSGLSGGWGTRIIEVSEKNSQRPLSNGRDSCEGAKFAEENAVCEHLKIL
jgi:hypothetical protein